MQINVKLAAHFAEVALRGIGVPAVVEVDSQRPQSKLFGHVQTIRRIATTAHANHAVVVAAFAGLSYLVRNLFHLSTPLVAGWIQLIQLVVNSAMIANSVAVEAYTRYLGVHHAAPTHRVSGCHLPLPCLTAPSGRTVGFDVLRRI